ncbi:MAG: SGNH/GDSL hydrolase family protein [Vicinamibacterales bacterium]
MTFLPNLSQAPIRTGLCFCALAALLAPVLAFPGEDDREQPGAIRALKMIRKDILTSDEADEMTGGYYEDLFTFSNRTISTNRLTTGKWATNWTKFEALPTAHDDVKLNSFLYFDVRPNLNSPESWLRGRYKDRHITNSHGMADREYSLERPAGVWRVAFIGDSLTRGLGASFGQNYESRLEARMNAAPPAPGVQGYEFLNFAVEGYRPTQFLWVLQHKVPRFQPQVNVVALTNLSFTRWEAHLVQLIHDGIDLHYPFLKELVARAGVRPDDDPHMFRAKLEPYRETVLRWVLETMKQSSKEQGTQLVVFLVPAVSTNEVSLRPGFAAVRAMVESLDIPLVDVSDTFAGFEDLSPYRVGPRNEHENDRGQALLAERLFERLQRNPRAWSLIAGTIGTEPAPATTGRVTPTE